MKVNSLSHVRLFATPWTAVYQAPPSMGFSRQEYWSGVPLSSLSQTSRVPLKPKEEVMGAAEEADFHPPPPPGSPAFSQQHSNSAVLNIICCISVCYFTLL